ncbi:MAG: hypothetical protein AB8B72_00140 [Crocinitomicaceae bacterium]
MKILLFIFIIFGSSTLKAQTNADNLKRFIFGANAGVKFASKKYAIRYTGAYQDQLINFLNFPSTYQRVRELLGNNDFYFDSFSLLYRFQPAISYGINFGYQASPNLSFEADLNFSNIRMIGGYTLVVEDPANFTDQLNFATGTVIGNESRFNGRINMNYRTDGETVKGIFGIAGLVNSWRMEENYAELNGAIVAQLFSGSNPANGFTSRVSGTGFGYGINLGIEVPFKKGIVMQIVYQPYITRMDYFNTQEVISGLGASYQKPGRVIEHDLMARFVWR